MALFNKFCGCFGLQTGSVIIGWLGLVVSILVFLHSAFTFSYFYSNGYIYVISWELSFVILTLLSQGALIYAALKNTKLMLVPWLLTVGLGILLFAAYLAEKAISSFRYPDVIESILMVIDGLFLYFWLCVFSFYQKIKENEVSKLECQNEGAELQEISSAPISDEKPPPDYSEYENKIYFE
ncbi:uncharacterized protein LOC143914817 [Arctopsyche grandis]|uniref:uncharacterized protein LOC143914817 n=1 Tax=Arctopsyche grandis TaxID=121162 RepID=UPI00406DA23A